MIFEQKSLEAETVVIRDKFRYCEMSTLNVSKEAHACTHKY